MNEFNNFISWYFVRSISAQFHFINNSLAKIEDVIGIRTNAKYLFTPIFGDTTFLGRTLSFFIRLIVITVGAVIFVISFAILITIPFLWIASLIGLFKYYVLALIPISGIMYYIFIGRTKPAKIQAYQANLNTIRSYCNTESLKILDNHTNQQRIQELIKSPQVINFIQRTLLPIEQILPTIENQLIPDDILNHEILRLAQENKIRYIRTPHVLAALITICASVIDPILKKNKLDIHQIVTFVAWEEYEFSLKNPPQLWDADYQVLVGGGTNRTWQGTVTPILNQFGYDLNAAVMAEPEKVIRTEIIKEVEKTLQKNQNANVLLIGEIGVGKDTLVREIAHAINMGAIHGTLWSKRIIDLDIGRLFAGATEKGSFENRVESIIDEIERSTNIILYLNDFSAAIETKTTEGINLFSLLQKPITSGRVKIIGSITPKEFKLLEVNNPLFIGQFTSIKVPETTPEETASIIHTTSLDLEHQYNLFFPYPLLDLIVTYAKNYIHQGHFPEKALALIEDIAVGAYNNPDKEIWNTQYGKRIPVLEGIVDKVVTEKTSIPVGEVQQTEAKTLLNLEEKFKEFIIDQTDAVHAIAEVLRRNRSGLRNTSKPIGSFLFVGPTGVGKTEMAKTLARIYFGSDKRMIRLDMSEYQNQESVQRIIGDTDNSTNLESLTELVRKQPYSLILLDELEKAHPRVLDLFLQVLDDARLTDSFGTTAEFNECIIIATSNAGTQEITKRFQTITDSDQYELIQKEIYHLLSPYFRTEFLNRFDDIILFKPLTKQSIEKIVQLQLAKLAEQLYESKKVTITFSPQTIASLVKEGYNMELGARPLQRAMQNTLESTIATMLLEGKITEGQTITI